MEHVAEPSTTHVLVWFQEGALDLFPSMPRIAILLHLEKEPRTDYQQSFPMKMMMLYSIPVCLFV